MISKANNDGDIENVEIMIPVKYESNFCRNVGTPLINCRTYFDLA